MLLGVLGPKLFAPSQWEHRFKVGLGLDLSSGTQVTLQAQTLSGKAPSADEMNAAVGVIEGRVNGTGNSGAQVQPQGTDLIIVTVPGKGSQQTIQLVSSTARLMFRQVLLYEPYSATSTTFGNPSLVNKNVLNDFNKLTCKPGATQAWKSQVGYQDTTPYNNPDVQVVACGSAGAGQWGKFALDVAKVRGTEVTSANAGLSTTSNQWQVNLSLNGQGAAAFSTLTSHLYNTYYAAGQAGNQNAAVLNQVAVALDGNVVSSPQIIGAIAGGNAQITGNFTQAEATQLQNELKFGSVPLDLKTLFVTSGSAQGGKDQLDAGLIAAAIGLMLVVVYSFFYYRGLGLVSVSSLFI